MEELGLIFSVWSRCAFLLHDEIGRTSIDPLNMLDRVSLRFTSVALSKGDGLHVNPGVTDYLSIRIPNGQVWSS
jgi:hypothetical protein